MSKILFSVETLDRKRYGVDFDGRTYTVVRWTEPKEDAKSLPCWKPAAAPHYGSLAAASRRLFELGLTEVTTRNITELVERVEEWGQRVACAARGEEFTGVKETKPLSLPPEQQHLAEKAPPPPQEVPAQPYWLVAGAQSGRLGGEEKTAEALPPPPWMKG